MKSNIRRGFRRVINQVILDTWNSTNGRVPHEPDYIANLVIKGTPRFHTVISSYPNLWNKVSTVGVFCHQSPMVEYSDGVNNKRCELGDLLWCHFHTNKHGDVFRNALLFQAKKSDTHLLNIPYNNTQLKLYREWPAFTYYQPVTLAGQRRHLQPSQPHAGAQFMAIDPRRPGMPTLGIRFPQYTWPIGTTTISPILLADTPLEAELVRFLFFSSGRQFDSYNNPSNDEWTKVVWDLLKNGLNHSFNRRRSGFNNDPRISGSASDKDGTFLFNGNQNDAEESLGSDFMDNFTNLFSEDIGKTKKGEDSEKGGGGPSVIVFITGEDNKRKQ